jgi:hypothetical protein
VPTYVQMLAALKAWLGKAEAQMPDGKADALLSAHLAPDMFVSVSPYRQVDGLP